MHTIRAREGDTVADNADTLKKGSRVTGGDRDRLAADLRKKYDAGASIRALADSTGRSYGFIHRMLTESGVTLRGRGGATRGKARTH
jgi:helix-turn-helix protein